MMAMLYKYPFRNVKGPPYITSRAVNDQTILKPGVLNIRYCNVAPEARVGHTFLLLLFVLSILSSII